MSPVTRRSLLIGGATVAAVALQPQIAQAHDQGDPRTIHFTLNGTVLDGGEQVSSLTLDTSNLGIDAASLTASTFTVRFTSVLPFPTPAGETVYSPQLDLERPVTKARLEHGKIVLDLSTIDRGTPGGTLGYMLLAGRNIMMKQTYTITQKTPLKTCKGDAVTLTKFTQGKLVDPEVDAYSYHKSSDGMNYRKFTPMTGRWSHGGRPLIVWLHGGGEGGLPAQNYYDNESQMRANRGALGFSTPEAQKVFGGAYVIAPQADTFWLENAAVGGPDYSGRLMKLIKEVVRKNDVDPKRIYVVGCSNGGYMSLEMTTVYHDFFAASVPICGVIYDYPFGSKKVLITDPELAGIKTPTWLVCSAADTTVIPGPNSEHAAQVIPGAIFTEPATVTRNGITYPGHWSWIYVARNEVEHNGQKVWQWMATKKLAGHN